MTSALVSGSFIDTVHRSENEKVGVLPPGPISNEDLYEKVNDKEPRIRQGL
jgi:hypothetical protein